MSTKEQPIIKKKIAAPKMYKVLILNDDFTTMEFVVMVLMVIFKKSKQDAHSLMLQVHNDGFGVCGVYPYEIAETKVAFVSQLAQQNKFPLRCKLEEA
ncbi:ATP-dependent Clp protease adapter ClpS [Lentisphaerota bacterium WC36G]|nr:ATP-dependent Clp protease adapter ClpS [Lentisphaerae bacterium WC36]